MKATRITNAVKAAGKQGRKSVGPDAMRDAEYQKRSHAIIVEALKQGFDVLQLENGDIITTGTQVIVTRYRWNPASRTMSRSAVRDEKERKKSPAPRKKSSR